MYLLCSLLWRAARPSRISRERSHPTKVSLAGEGRSLPMLPPALCGDAAVGLEHHASVPTEQSHLRC